jgi:membrane carboxypeptidase/penicillin-binding protein PbpC
MDQIDHFPAVNHASATDTLGIKGHVSGERFLIVAAVLILFIAFGIFRGIRSRVVAEASLHEVTRAFSVPVVEVVHPKLATDGQETGTSHDAWFAGFTSNLICVVWVGNDDYSDVKLAGAQAAAPIWAEFMNRAARLPQYSDMRDFTPPEGIVEVKLDKNTNLQSDATCPEGYITAFLDGTQPNETCSHVVLEKSPAEMSPATPLLNREQSNDKSG